MANVARLDSKMRREYAKAFFLKHKGATLQDGYDEVKKKFNQGMSWVNLRKTKEAAVAELEQQKKGTKPLGTTGPSMSDAARSMDEASELMNELNKTIAALAKTMKSERCPLFRVVLTKGPGDKVQVQTARRGTITENQTY